MTRSGASAARQVDRIHQFSLLGLALSGYLALAGSGSLDAPAALLAGLGVAGLLSLFWIMMARFGRGYAAVQILACLELVVAAMLSANLSFFLFLAAFLLFLVASLASGEIRRSTRAPVLVARGGLRGFPARLGGLACFVALGILALTTALFFVLPRTAHAALSGLVAERYHLPGFSGQVRLGEIGAVLNRNTPAMHVHVVDADRPLFLKWRGAALRSFDGKKWTPPSGAGETIPVDAGRTILASDEQRRRSGARITYEIQLETISSDVLFLAGVPEVLWIGSPSVFHTSGGDYRLDHIPRERLRYGAVSYLGPASSLAGPGDGYLQLPVLDTRIRALAREVTARASSDQARALALEDYLRGNLGYTTELPSTTAADPLADFLFERRKGHCEYFASAMAVMLRTLGIPSRLVAGFQGGTLNPITGWYVIRASDAHTWVEAWIGGRGWTTFDPTPGSRGPRENPLWSRALFYADAAEMFWQNWVIGYDFERQLTLAARMQSSGRLFGARGLDRVRLGWLTWQAIAVRSLRAYGAVVFLFLLLAVAVGLLAPRARKWRQARQRLKEAARGGAIASDATLLYSRMLSLLKGRGHSKPAWFTPAEFARTLPPSEAAELVARFTSAYHDLRYGGRPDAAARMLALLDRLQDATLAPRT
jgi:transglutaminase-like putative cysteine protease